jgi:Ion channel
MILTLQKLLSELSLFVLALFFSGACILTKYLFQDKSLTPLILYSASIIFVYGAIFLALEQHLIIKHEEKGSLNLRFAFLYFCATIFLITLFTVGWFFFNNVAIIAKSCSPPQKTSEITDILDFLYFSTVSFSTIGFGDYIPCTKPARLFLSFEAIISSLHSVVFFSTLILKRDELQKPQIN